MTAVVAAPTLYMLEPSDGFLMMLHRALHSFTSSLSRLAAALVLCAAGCAMTAYRLPDLDRKFYDNLANNDDRAAFLKLQESQRQAFLEQKGLWARWTELSAEERQAVQKGEVKVDYKEFVAFMAWGPPADIQSSRTAARAVRFHTFIRCTSGPRRGRYVMSNLDCDGTSSEIEVAVENDLITETKLLN
jgi:hypothetical protein